MPSIEIFYDVVSPYSLLAFKVLRRYQSIWKVDVQFKPFFLGGVMQATGNQPPAYLPARGMYMAKDIVRNAAYFDVPLVQPPKFPANTLLAQRVLTAISISRPDVLADASEALWAVYWQLQQDIEDPVNISSALATSTKCDTTLIAKWIADANTADVKARLKAATEEAVARGAYGAPTIFVKTSDTADSEMFFGSDRFPLIALHLGKPWFGPVPNATPQSKL